MLLLETYMKLKKISKIILKAHVNFIVHVFNQYGVTGGIGIFALSWAEKRYIEKNCRRKAHSILI
jgi:hypothetical protein